MFRLALFASGSGTNVQNICEYFQNHNSIKPEIVLSDKEDAYALESDNNFNKMCEYFNYITQNWDIPLNIKNPETYRQFWNLGYLRLVPSKIIKTFKSKILNIHPSLLPKFGGKGFYGHHVHKSVLESNEEESGITIHLVNEKYDEGKILFQKSTPIFDNDDVASLSSRIHNLEYKYYPQIIEKYLLNQL